MKNENDSKFFNGLQKTFREHMPKENLVYGLQYFLCIHFNDFDINFLREVRDKIDWEDVYKKLEHDGNINLLKENKKMFKEFFGKN